MQRLKHEAPVQSVAWSANNKALITISSDQEAIIWNAETGKKQQTLSSAVAVCAFHPYDSCQEAVSHENNIQLFQNTRARIT